MDYSLIFPDDFDDYVPELADKGWFALARLVVAEHRYPLIFYDPFRLQQEMNDELERRSFFFEPNLLVIPSVTRENMQQAVDDLMRSGGLSGLSAE
jgi:hypothetical protein